MNILDLVSVNSKQLVAKISIIAFFSTSDHNSMAVNLQCALERKTFTKIRVVDFCAPDYDRMIVNNSTILTV